ncbi:MAG: response regulator [Defluviitaleaceae bacterium]|nr:response regulator [Defluviitaleaceae bacterium]
MDEKKLIYVADDDPAIREALKMFLESMGGYEVIIFEDGDLLLAEFKSRPSDLVILDVMMPGSSGFVICQELRTFSHVPVIMLTARDSDLDYQTAMDLGSDDFFTKPTSPLNVVSRVNAIFRRIKYERDAAEKRQTT